MPQLTNCKDVCNFCLKIYFSSGVDKIRVTRMRCKHLCGLVIIVITSLPLTTASLGQSIAILGKEDAKQVFALNQYQWIQNVARASNLGIARMLRLGRKNVGMVTEHPGIGHMIVKPDFGKNPDKPDFIQVTIAYLPRHAAIFNEEMRRSLIRRYEEADGSRV